MNAPEATASPIPSHAVLDACQGIAWDIDGTLIDNVNAPFFAAFIRATPGKSHHVVTHRLARYGLDTEAMLARIGLPPALFAGIHYCPEDLREAYEASFSRDPDRLARFLDWKGLTAAANGCGVLVDDVPDTALDGCRRHGVAFLNSWCRSFPREPDEG